MGRISMEELGIWWHNPDPIRRGVQDGRKGGRGKEKGWGGNFIFARSRILLSYLKLHLFFFWPIQTYIRRVLSKKRFNEGLASLRWWEGRSDMRDKYRQQQQYHFILPVRVSFKLSIARCFLTNHWLIGQKRRSLANYLVHQVPKHSS